MKGDCYSCEKFPCCGIVKDILETHRKYDFVKTHSVFMNKLAEQCKYYKH